MRTRAKVLLIGFCGMAAAVLISAVFLAMNSDVVRERYSSYSDAVSKEALAHGMVPAFLPKSATGIVAERNLDVDTLIVEFTYGNDFDAHYSGLKKSSDSLPAEVLETTSLGEDVGRLEVFSNVGSDRTCASHLMIDKQKRRAAYIHNLAPHRVGCN